MFRVSAAQLPHTENVEIQRMINLQGSTNEDIITNEVNQFKYRPVVMNTSAERSHYFNKYDKQGLTPDEAYISGKSHPLARYSSNGYYDPAWESIEYDRLAYHASVADSIISSTHNKSMYNTMVDVYSNENMYKDPSELAVGSNTRTGLHEFQLNQDVGNSFDSTFNGVHEENRYSINDTHGTSSMAYGHRIYDPYNRCEPIDVRLSKNRNVNKSSSDGPTFHYSSEDVNRNINVEHSGLNVVDTNGIPLFPEARPFIQRERPNYQSSRRPAGTNFSTVNTQKQVENFHIVPCDKKDNATFCATLTKKEMQDINSYFSNNNKKESFGGKSNGNFENGIAEEADYMYMSALKVRANAVCEYLRNNKAYSEWKNNWDLLNKNLKGGRLFERLNESEADIAYVINKGDEVKFRIRDEDRYVPINTYQYVLYHEMAHMSTKELQHTPGFMKLLNIISLAGFECGFIDFRKLPSSYYMTNGAPILCRSSMKEEVCLGAQWLKESNPKSARYYEGIIAAVKSA